MDSEENVHITESAFLSEKYKEKKCRFRKSIIKLIIIIIVLFIITLKIYLLYLQNDIDKILIISTKMNEKQVDTQKNIIEEIKTFENSLRKIEEKEILEFRKINSENILYDRIKYKKSENPDITVVLTMQNQAHCIHKALRSIQNQSLKNLEILIVIDCSYDNSTETIEKYMQEDERIVVVKHDTLEGIVKTRSEGIRLAKGKYIIALDGDDAFLHKDILYNSLYIANLGNLDVVEFLASIYRNGNWSGFIHDHNTSDIVYQPELKTKFFIINKKNLAFRPIRCRTIWAKIVRNEIFKKAIDNIGSKYTEDYIMGYEDTMMTVSLYEVAQSYYLLKQNGLYYSRDDKKGRFPQIPNKKCIIRNNVIRGLDALKFLHFLMERFRDNELEQQTLYHEIISINSYNYSNYYKHVNHHYEMLYSLLDEMVKSKYLTEKEKIRLTQIKTEVKFKEDVKKYYKNRY